MGSLAELTSDGNETYMGFGKHSDLTYMQVYRRHRSYLIWARMQSNPGGGLYDFVRWANAYEGAIGVQRDDEDYCDDVYGHEYIGGYDHYDDYGDAYAGDDTHCEDCGELTYPDDLDDFNRCEHCSIKCEACGCAVRAEEEVDDFGHCENCEIVCDGCDCSFERPSDLVDGLCIDCEENKGERNGEEEEEEEDDGEVEVTHVVTREERDAALRAAAVDVEKEPSPGTAAAEPKVKTEVKTEPPQAVPSRPRSESKSNAAPTRESTTPKALGKRPIEAPEDGETNAQSKKSKAEVKVKTEVQMATPERKSASKKLIEAQEDAEAIAQSLRAHNTPEKVRAPKDEDNADVQGAIEQSIADQRGHLSGAGSSGTNPPEAEQPKDDQRPRRSGRRGNGSV
jgi:hypothetical protein